MTNQAQLIAIAKWMGWTHLRVASNKLYGTEPNSDYGKESWYAGCPGDGCHVPDYTRDLNAMHEAERHLDDEQALTYVRESASHWPTSSKYETWLKLTTATALQKAEALLRTLGLWTEDGPQPTMRAILDEDYER